MKILPPLSANSCFPNQNYSNNLPSYPNQLHLYNPFMEEQKTSDVTPSVSPTPSSCSSNHDSSNSIMSTHSDHSDDDAVYGMFYCRFTKKVMVTSLFTYTYNNSKIFTQYVSISNICIQMIIVLFLLYF